MRRPLCFVAALVASVLAGCGGGGGGGTPAVPPTISIDGLSVGGKLSAVSTYALTVTETIDGQSVTPGNLTFSLDTAAVGTLSGATLTTGANNATGHITVTDAAHGLTATVTVTVESTHPATNGDAISFAGTLTERIVRPLPAPTAVQPPYTFRYTVAITSKTSTGNVFAGETGLTDFATVETDTGSTPPLPVTSTNSYEKFVTATDGTVNVVSFGSQASDTNGSAYRTQLGAGNGLLDILPEQSGKTWRNNAAENYVENEPDSTSIARTVKADGSYVETDRFADTSIPASTITVNADLSGSYTNLFYIANVGGANLAFGAPLANGGAKSIPLTVVQGGTTTEETIPDWYPATNVFADSAALTTARTIPSACGVPASLGTSASEIVEETTRLDPVLGTYEKRQEQTYLVPFYGTVCTVLADTLDDYYDYSGQSAHIFAAAPQQITTLAETLGFRSGTIGRAIAGARTQSVTTESAARIAQNRIALSVGRASFERAVGRLYRERRRALHAYLAHYTHPVVR